MQTQIKNREIMKSYILSIWTLILEQTIQLSLVAFQGVDKEFERENLSSGDDFEDYENEFSSDEMMVDKQGHYKHCFDDDRKLVTAEIQKKMLHEDGDPD